MSEFDWEFNHAAINRDQIEELAKKPFSQHVFPPFFYPEFWRQPFANQLPMRRQQRRHKPFAYDLATIIGNR